MSTQRKTAELVISDNRIAELRTPPDWLFISQVKALPDCYDDRRNTHNVPSGRVMEVLEAANANSRASSLCGLCVARVARGGCVEVRTEVCASWQRW